MRIPSVTFVALALVACGVGSAAPRKPAPSGTGSAAGSSIALPIPSAPLDAGSPVDLLWATNARVAVSSRVDNEADLPAHLTDHKPETAWNGKTGNLVGAWIKFQVPVDATVDHVLLTVGFDKTTAKGEDLFTENHRIAKVRVSRAGQPLRDVALDPNDRKPQTIEIHAAGGDFQIEVLEVVAGSKSNWKEIAVSELAVMGTPGASRKTQPSAPSVWVGSYDDKELAYDENVGATYGAACLAWARAHDSVARKAREQLAISHNLPDETSTCSGPKKPVAGKGALLEYAHESEVESRSGFYEVHFTGDVLALKTSAGAAITNIRLSGVEEAMYWSVTYKLLSEVWDGERLVIDVEHARVTDSDGAGTPEELHSEDKTVYRTTCESATAKCKTIQTSTRSGKHL